MSRHHGMRGGKNYGCRLSSGSGAHPRPTFPSSDRQRFRTPSALNSPSFSNSSKERNHPRLSAMILRNRRKSSMTKRRTNLDNLINGPGRDCGTQRITRRGVSPQGRYIIILGQGTAHNTCTRIWPDCGLPGFVWRIRSGA